MGDGVRACTLRVCYLTRGTEIDKYYVFIRIYCGTYMIFVLESALPLLFS